MEQGEAGGHRVVKQALMHLYMLLGGCHKVYGTSS
jgi:hypothetical protein